ncbi:MAG TPA: TIR domain-containing protein [Longimicrobium sp.]|nr:TIR domain-containing protein [Longimicrobium sp.]
MRALIIESNEDNRTVYRTIIEHFIPDVQIDEMRPSAIVSAADAVEIAKTKYAWIILPLSLPNFNSLRIAEFTHHFGSATRLILLSRTDANRSALSELYDRALLKPCEPRKLVSNIQDLLSTVPDRTKSEEQIEEAIERILGTATCFRIGRRGSDPGRGAKLRDYRDPSYTGAKMDDGDEPLSAPIQRREKARLTYDVALSFAGEDREYVEQVAAQLRMLGVKVFYDRFEEVNLWGKDLAEHLGHVYGNDARFVVLFLSRAYAAKAWPRHEKRFALARQMEFGEERILPVRFDDTEIPGLPATVAYLDLRSLTPIRLAELIRTKMDQPAA